MAALLAAGLYRMVSSLLGADSPQATPGTDTGSLNKPPRPLTPEERALLERLHGGRSFEGVKVDEGFFSTPWLAAWCARTRNSTWKPVFLS